MRKEVGQLSLADALVARRGKSGRELARIGGLLDWSGVEAELAGLRCAAEGRPGYPPALMFRALLLAQWHGLSDPELEAALEDRLSFRAFIGLALDETVPDETTLCRFRNELVRRGLCERLLAEVNRQLEAQGLVLKRGTLVDASLVAADADVRKGPDGRKRTSDPEAGFCQARGKPFYGYKMHVAVDAGSGLVRRALVTPAHVHDSVPVEELVLGDEAAVLADKAYDTGPARAAIVHKGALDWVMMQARRGRPLQAWQQAVNAKLKPLRAGVERTFGLLKRSYGWRRARYRGLMKVHGHLQLACAAANLRRALVLLAS